MVDVINDGYSATPWKKGDVLTAEKLNKIETAISQIVDRFKGYKQNEGGTASEPDTSVTLATYGTLSGLITEHNISNTKTIQSITQDENGVLHLTTQSIAKANTPAQGEATFGIVKAGTNLTTDNGIISLIDNPSISNGLSIANGLSVSGNTELGSSVSDGNGNVTNGTTIIQGAATLNNTLYVSGTTQLNGGITNGLNITGTLNITGNTTLGVAVSDNQNNLTYGTTTINGITNIYNKATINSLEVTNTTKLVGGIINGLNVIGGLNIEGNTELGTYNQNNLTYGTTTIHGAAILNNTLSVTGATTLNEVTLTGALTIGSGGSVPSSWKLTDTTYSSGDNYITIDNNNQISLNTNSFISDLTAAGVDGTSLPSVAGVIDYCSNLIPDFPSQNGTYVLKFTKTDNNVSLEWVAEGGE